MLGMVLMLPLAAKRQGLNVPFLCCQFDEVLRQLGWAKSARPGVLAFARWCVSLSARAASGVCEVLVTAVGELIYGS